jgi:hypothetical protein
LRIITAFFDIFDMAFDVLKESTIIDWKSSHFDRLIGLVVQFMNNPAPGEFVGNVFGFRSVFSGIQYSHVLLVQFAMQRSRGEPLITDSFPALKRLFLSIGVGSLPDGLAGQANGAPDQMTKANEILSVILCNGPLSNICNLGTVIFEELLSSASDTSEDIKRAWNLLERMPDTPHLQLVDASGGMWAKFDQLRAAVRGAFANEGSNRYAKKLRLLLDIFERVDRRDPRPFHLVFGTIPTSGMYQSTPHGRTPTRQSNLDPVVVNESPTSSIPTTQPGFGAEIPVPSAYPPHVPQVHPLSFPSPHFPGTSVDPTNLQAQAHVQTVLTDTPVLPLDMLSNPYPSPSPSSGPLGVLPPGDAEQHNPIDGD